MTDAPEELGYITVSFAGITARADSDDAESQPDVDPIAATVGYSAVGLDRDPIADLPSGRILVELPSGKAFIDSTGKMVAPADGRGDTPSPTGNLLRVLATHQPTYLDRTWAWRFDIKLEASGRSYVVNVTGSPDDEINIADEIAAGNVTLATVPSAVIVPVEVTEVDGVYGAGTQAAIIDAALDYFAAAQWTVPNAYAALNKTTNVIYPIGAVTS